MKIGFLDTWYGMKAPEQENMIRYKEVFERLGHNFEFLTPDGYLQSDLTKHANGENFDLILCTDASQEGMEILPDVPTFFIDWCPYGYLTVEHHRNYIKSFNYFDAILTSCYNQEFERIKYTYFKTTPASDEEHCFFPSLSENNMLPPAKLKKYKLFYAGINKDSGTKKGRYYELFSLLDNTDYLELYGPNNKKGECCWKEFKSCCGEIPFDGHSILERINQAGVCLALNSKFHNKAGFITNRIFEACTSGAAIITDDNEYTRKYFGDNVFYVDINKDEKYLYNDILNILNFINSNPNIVMQKIKNCQEIFKTHFSIEKSISNLLAIYDEYNKSIKDKQNHPLVNIIAFANSKKEFDYINSQITSQAYTNISVLYSIPQDVNIQIENLEWEAKLVHSTKQKYTERFLELKNFISGKYFVFIDKNSIWQRRFLKKVTDTIVDKLYSYSGTFIQDTDLYPLTNKPVNFKQLLTILNTMNGNEVAKSFAFFEEHFSINSILFSSKILDIIDQKISFFDYHPHIYLVFQAYFSKQDEGNYTNSITAGILEHNNTFDTYKNYYRCDALISTNIYSAFANQITKYYEELRDEELLITKCLNLNIYKQMKIYKIIDIIKLYLYKKPQKYKTKLRKEMKIINYLKDKIC